MKHSMARALWAALALGTLLTAAGCYSDTYVRPYGGGPYYGGGYYHGGTYYRGGGPYYHGGTYYRGGGPYGGYHGGYGRSTTVTPYGASHTRVGPYGVHHGAVRY
jgi:hypothetical protein